MELRERLEYFVTEEGHFVGKLTNAQGCLCEGDSLEGLKRNAREQLGVWRHVMDEMFDREFDVKPITKDEYYGAMEDMALSTWEDMIGKINDFQKKNKDPKALLKFLNEKHPHGFIITDSN